MHPLIKGRKLILGGVEIAHDKGLDGHSDADALLHALTDALLSAAALKDIGFYFPDSDDKYKNADSRLFVKEALSMLAEKNLKVKNASLVVMAQKPRLSPYAEKIRGSLSALLGVSENSVGISFTTTEGLGTVGREEGIACQAYVLLERDRDLLKMP